MNHTAPSGRQVLCILGNPKAGGFVHGCVDRVASRLQGKGVAIDRLPLVESDIQHCTGCFACLRTGSCPLPDDMPTIIARIRAADGMVVGASVRNGFFPALFKTLYERITYPVGFARDLRKKYVLGIGAVGVAGGRKALGTLITFREFQTYISDFLFFRTGIPGTITVEHAAPKLDRAADRFLDTLLRRPSLPPGRRLTAWVDDTLTRKLMLERDQSGTFDYVLKSWREKGLIR